jgi:HTH-type transcriptional regulator, quorum sensing regulator NprR
MLAGRLIKFYRENAGLTQGQLCEGICSVTHLSKIERGITEYSEEITNLISKRLNICLEDEFVRYQDLQQKLNKWHDKFIYQQNKESESLKKEIETEVLIHFPDFYGYYQLLSARYYLTQHNIEHALLIIKELQKKEAFLSDHDRNMLKHVSGMYYFIIGQYRDCIQILQSIDQNQYQQFEYYYHLALAYHLIHSNIISYYYAEKVLHYFRKTLNVIRIIDTEIIMLLQLNAKELHDFDETKERYEQLICTCDSINEIDRKSKLLHNLAFEHAKRKKYKEASTLYLKAMELIDELAPHYLPILDGYITTCNKGKLLSNEILLGLVHKGLKIAQSTNSYNKIFFELHLYQLKQDEEDDLYYRFIEKTAIPIFKNMGFTMLIEHYEKKLFQYFYKNGDSQKALELANNYIQGKKSYYDLE